MNNRLPQGVSISDPLDQQALDWFIRAQDGLSAEQTRDFQRWIDLDSAHAQAYDRWEQDWQAFGAIAKSELDVLRRSWPEPAKPESPPAKSKPSLSQPKPQQPRRSFWLRPMGATAVLGVCMLVGLGLGREPVQPEFAGTYAMQAGEPGQVRLPDQSVLDLDTATDVDVAFYKGHRDLILKEGQVWFDIQADPARPFRIVAGDVRITVVGTRFSVRHTPASPGHPDVEVAVESGRVSIEPADYQSHWWTPWRWKGSERAVMLEPGQQLRSLADGAQYRISRVAGQDVAPWRGQRISFNDMPLDHALAEFARYGHAVPTLDDSRVAQLRITGTFNPYRPETFYRVLPKILPLRIVMRDDQPHVEMLN